MFWTTIGELIWNISTFYYSDHVSWIRLWLGIGRKEVINKSHSDIEFFHKKKTRVLLFCHDFPSFCHHPLTNDCKYHGDDHNYFEFQKSKHVQNFCTLNFFPFYSYIPRTFDIDHDPPLTVKFFRSNSSALNPNSCKFFSGASPANPPNFLLPPLDR